MAGHANQPLTELAEEMAIGRAVAAPAAAPIGSARRMTSGFVKEDQVEIAVVVWFATTKLAQRQHDRLAPTILPLCEALPEAARRFVRQVRVVGTANHRHAKLVDELLV